MQKLEVNIYTQHEISSQSSAVFFSYLRAIKCRVNLLSFFYYHQIEKCFQKILRASRNVPLVCVFTLAASLLQRSNVRNYPARFGVSATHFCNAAKNFLTQETAKNVL